MPPHSLTAIRRPQRRSTAPGLPNAPKHPPLHLYQGKATKEVVNGSPDVQADPEPTTRSAKLVDHRAFVAGSFHQVTVPVWADYPA
jgi:hypothetical protein